MDNEKDLEHINEIDMECNVYDDDDDLVIINKPNTIAINNNEGSEERDYVAKTGVMIDLSDDDDIKKPMKVISADFDKNNNLQINKNWESENIKSDFSGYNEIDMECNSCEDEDNDNYIAPKKVSNDFIDFGDEDYFEDKELVDEEMIQEKKTKTTQGAVEANYWDKLQKKHEASNKKGAYNTHFHLAGNPEKEREMFNHDMKPNIPAAPKVDGSLAGEGMELSGAPAASASGATSAGFTGTAAAGGEGGGCCESLNEDLQYSNLLKEILAIIGFEVIKNANGSFMAMDLCDENNDFECENSEDLWMNLKPYVDDCFIYPLQIQTGEKFDNCADWCNWYTPEMKEKFPKCVNDIKYCDVLANHNNKF